MLTWSLLGLALLLIPAADPARRRLAWLSGNRWSPADGVPAVAHGTAAQPRLLASWPRSQRGLAGAGCAGLLTGWLAGIVPGVLAAVTAAVLSWCWRLHALDRLVDRDRSALAAALAAIAEEYAAGATMGAALSRAAASAGRFKQALEAAGSLAELGADPQAALAQLPALAPLAVACRLASRSGAPFGSVLQGIRADLAADRNTRGAVGAAVAGPRASAFLLAGLPAVGLAMGTGMGAHPVRILLHSTVGLAVLAAGVLLDLAGLCWTLRLTRQVLR